MLDCHWMGQLNSGAQEYFALLLSLRKGSELGIEVLCMVHLAETSRVH